MDRYFFNNDFSKDVIYEKMSKIMKELDEERKKGEGNIDLEKERELIYAQWIQGLKLNTLSTNRNFYF